MRGAINSSFINILPVNARSVDIAGAGAYSQEAQSLLASGKMGVASHTTTAGVTSHAQSGTVTEHSYSSTSITGH